MERVFPEQFKESKYWMMRNCKSSIFDVFFFSLFQFGTLPTRVRNPIPLKENGKSRWKVKASSNKSLPVWNRGPPRNGEIIVII